MKTHQDPQRVVCLVDDLLVAYEKLYRQYYGGFFDVNDLDLVARARSCIGRPGSHRLTTEGWRVDEKRETMGPNARFVQRRAG